jgi:2',3'-cyclic-nucleotide 2'-phosphodiesterase (5'-nucleotidase family)
MKNRLRKSSSPLLLLSFLLLTLGFSCSPKVKLQRTETSHVKLDKDAPEDPAIVALIEPYKSKLDKEMNQVLIVSEDDAVKNQPEGKLGNLVADITLIKANEYLKANNLPTGDICILNNGGLRTSLPKGEILMSKIFELMPFENQIVVLTMNGQQTQEMLNYIARSNGVPMAGARMKIREEKAVEVMIGGQAFDINKSYQVVTSDYLAGGGDKMRFFSSPLNFLNTGLLLRDAIADYLIEENKKGNTLKPKLDGRISVD